MENKLMGMADAAKALGVSRWTVLRRVEDGSLKAQIVNSGHVFTADEVARAEHGPRVPRRGNRPDDAAPAA